MRFQQLIVVALEGRCPGDHLVKNAAERVKIAAEADQLSGGALWRDVCRATDDLEDRACGDACRDRCVDERDGSVLANDHVLGREITLKQARAMNLIECRCELRGDRDRVGKRAFREVVAQRVAFDLHTEKPGRFIDDPRCENLRQIRVSERCELVEFASEATSLSSGPRGGDLDELEHSDASGRVLTHLVSRACAARGKHVADIKTLCEGRRDR